MLNFLRLLLYFRYNCSCHNRRLVQSQANFRCRNREYLTPIVCCLEQFFEPFYHGSLKLLELHSTIQTQNCEKSKARDCLNYVLTNSSISIRFREEDANLVIKGKKRISYHHMNLADFRHKNLINPNF